VNIPFVSFHVFQAITQSNQWNLGISILENHAEKAKFQPPASHVIERPGYSHQNWLNFLRSYSDLKQLFLIPVGNKADRCIK
jgi:hypothetical protein